MAMLLWLIKLGFLLIAVRTVTMGNCGRSQKEGVRKDLKDWVVLGRDKVLRLSFYVHVRLLYVKVMKHPRQANLVTISLFNLQLWKLKGKALRLSQLC